MRPNWFCPICRNPIRREKHCRTPRSGFCSFCIAIDEELKVSLSKDIKNSAEIWAGLAKRERP